MKEVLLLRIIALGLDTLDRICADTSHTVITFVHAAVRYVGHDFWKVYRYAACPLYADAGLLPACR